MKKLTHIDSSGEAAMVDVSSKPLQAREAVARGEIRWKATQALVQSQKIAGATLLRRRGWRVWQQKNR
jgi:cyclic pyranopterin phosphate synthase